MPDDFNVELRASWRELDVPDSEQASRTYEQHRLRADRDSSLLSQAAGIVMSTYDTDQTIADQLLKQLARASEVSLPDLARAVTEAASGASAPTNDPAAQAATMLLSGAGSTAGGRPVGHATGGSIDLRDAEPTSRLSGTG